MNTHRERFSFTMRDPNTGSASLAPLLPLTLKHTNIEIPVFGLIDTGAAVNVLPWKLGITLGGNWDTLPPVKLSGNLSQTEARVFVCEAMVGAFTSKRLAFAWSQRDDVPVLLGQVNFLIAFDILMSRSGQWFEIGEPNTWGS